MTRSRAREANLAAGAVIYLRVSTREQATRGGEAEGFSIPAQREACLRKAEALGVTVDAEFVDAGESARSTRRPQLQAMLNYLREHPTQFVIVHKIDRLARNRVDDVQITLAIQNSGANLVSVTENIDDTPQGKLMHTIFSGLAAFYSDNLATEVMKGLHQKARSGGTIGKAYLGYLNVRHVVNGVEKREVEIDPVRGPLMAWAFDAFATGKWTLKNLHAELIERGLMTVPGPERPSKPISVSQLHRFLRSPYYIGKITYNGIEYEGRHQPLVPVETWQKVQDILSSRNRKGEKYRTHTHYLKSSLYCGHCLSRLIVSHNTNRHGTTYPYYVCVGRHQKRTSCQQRAVRIEHLEERVELLYEDPVNHLTEAEADELRQYLTAEFRAIHGRQRAEQRRLERERTRLEDERLKLLQAHYAGAVGLDLLKQEQTRIGNQLAAIERRLARIHSRLGDITGHLDRALTYLTDLDLSYRKASEIVRRQINQAIFERIEVGEEGTTDGSHTQLYGALLNPQMRTAAHDYVSRIEAARAQNVESRRSSPATAFDLAHLRSFLVPARRAGGVKETQLAEGVGFEPTDSFLSSAFKALALGRYANPPERDGPAGPALGPNSGRAEVCPADRALLTRRTVSPMG